METTSTRGTQHIGRKIEILRNLKGMKQEALAIETGLSQPQISAIENSAEVEDEVLNIIASALNLTPTMIKEFDENHLFYHIDNKLENVTINDSGTGIQQVFNPLEKVVELYERLLASEKEKLEILKALKKDN
ncbi:helix-turn-helix transcriptional regulator [Flavihumibacter rivuli]|uniref:helix-turn-helix domain-containing protein n=1 Tax=Flavihumibacter rivuli TaxID=2838156 RepID=UPI001BDE7F0F|nr:helix-turn-helix transcriptional regulator [Flavihumibacter rivuli]ULQ55858.1 helix-turn-helix transcriptional regulator [Flavihumibacter rivuli]